MTTITCKNGTLVDLEVPWALGKAGFVDAGGMLQLAFAPDPASETPFPAVGDEIDVGAETYIVKDHGRDASTRLRILYLRQ